MSEAIYEGPSTNGGREVGSDIEFRDHDNREDPDNHHHEDEFDESHSGLLGNQFHPFPPGLI